MQTLVPPSTSDGNFSVECVECPAGSIRQASSNYSECEYCAQHFYLSLASQQCEPCVLADGYSCDSVSDYVDDCSGTGSEDRTLSSEVNTCVCGCAHCNLYNIDGMNNNFKILQGCRPGCTDGFKLLTHDDSADFTCVSVRDAMQTENLALFNTGYHKLSNVDSRDWTAKFCDVFFSLNAQQIQQVLHMQSCDKDVTSSFGARATVLAMFILNAQELLDIDLYCSFRCEDGYALQRSLTSYISECVEIQHCPSLLDSHDTFTPHYALQICAPEPM